MRAVDIIIKKRDRQELTDEEIRFFIQGFTRGEIPDYQASAWAMAVLLNGMTPRETADLTMAMARSGEMLDLSGVVPNAVDKHSTGGVGDKTTLVVQPTVAACGLPVGKISGRGLGFTGGTLDKLESIPGFRTKLTRAEFIEQLRTVGLVLSGQSSELAPADGKLYALRDVTGTVLALPLIASSIMSKKIAAGARAIVLDVKVGLGSFMRTVEAGRGLAEMMIAIARYEGREALALLSDMNQPLGCAVGNALELKEAIQTLRGGGPADFREHCLIVAGHMLVLGKLVGSPEEGHALADQALVSGRSWQRFRALVAAQGGEVSCVDEPDRLPKASVIEIAPAPRRGYLSGIHARLVGETSVRLGAGRERKDDPIDHSVGIEILHKVGDFVEMGEPLFVVHARSQADLALARENLLAAHTWSAEPVNPLPLVHGVVT